MVILGASSLLTVPGNTGTYVEAPVLDSIDSDISGAAAKLSFGATVPLTGFTIPAFLCS